VLGSGRYEGSSAFLRWWPKVLLVLAFILVLYGWNHSMLPWATLFVLGAWLHARWIPWRFTAAEEGIELTFAFGRHLFLPKPELRVRMEYVGAMALVGRTRRFGYPLTDGLLYVPDRRWHLRAALEALGYDVV
jgi:hypothetical protein